MSARRAHVGGPPWNAGAARDGLFALVVVSLLLAWHPAFTHAAPNMVLLMADDLGYGDVAYNGNKLAKTPCLDVMARKAICFDRFYAAAPVCSPTRGSCLTGRHPYRYHIHWAGETPLPPEEITLAEALKTAGYATGHFGKWHLGALSKTIKQGYFAGPVDPAKYSPPWENGFDVCFSTESMAPTYNPYYQVGGAFGSNTYQFVQNVPIEMGQRTGGFRWRDSYWTGPGQLVDEWLEGDDSTIIMDRSLRFIHRCASAKRPFLAVIWFHTPHTPVAAGNEDRAPFDKLSMDAQHWHGAIMAMDRQIGRLRDELRELGIAENTIVWFCSDNGPSYCHDLNSTGGLRGKKATLWEGGIRVPAIVEWPKRFTKPRVVKAAISTSDLYPTLLNIANVKMRRQPPLDGIDVMPILEDAIDERPSPLAFQSPLKSTRDVTAEKGTVQMALMEGVWKLITFNDKKTYSLFNLEQDPGETTDVADKHPYRVKQMAAILGDWVAECAKSAEGKDYHRFKPEANPTPQ